MKRLFISLSVLLNIFLVLFFLFNWYLTKSESEYFDFITPTYEKKLPIENGQTRICLVGNSITANWENLRPYFFDRNGFINRGVGGHSSSQILLRFQKDVISANPTHVVLNTGINDIAKADGFYNEEFTLQNIQSIIDICKSRHIGIVLSSVLPATEISINRVTKLRDMQSVIERLNKRIKLLARDNGLIYIDYHTLLQNEDGTFNNKYNFDGVHPNEEGYIIMEQLLLDALKELN